MQLPSPVDHLPRAAQTTLLLCQVALAGCVDAIGWLLLGGVFVSFMSGNSTQLAVALASGQGGWALRVACVLGAFFAGVFCGAIMREVSRSGSHAPLFLAAAVALAVALTLARASGVSTLHMLPLAFAMGLLNNVRRLISGAPVGGTFVTGAFVAAAQGAARWALGRAPFSALAPYALSWLALGGGAVVGAALSLYAGDIVALLTPVLWATALALIHLWIASRAPSPAGDL